MLYRCYYDGQKDKHWHQMVVYIHRVYRRRYWCRCILVKSAGVTYRGK